MKNTYYNYLMILVIVFLISVSVKGCKSQQFITENQAMDAIRVFEGNTNLQFKTLSFEQNTEGSSWSHWYYYNLILVADPDPDFIWNVDAITGEVNYAFYGNRYPNTNSETPNGSYTQAQCKQIALDFARAKYNNFDNMGFQSTSDCWNDDGWQFKWNQIIQYNARTMNSINIEVNSLTGQIQSYSSTRFPVPNLQQAPAITAQQAIILAQQAANITNPISNDPPYLYADMDGASWTFRVVGEDNANEVQDFLVEVDANTGEVTGLYPPGGPSGPMPDGMPKTTNKKKIAAIKLKSDVEKIKKTDIKIGSKSTKQKSKTTKSAKITAKKLPVKVSNQTHK